MTTDNMEKVKLPFRRRLLRRVEIALGKKKQIIGFFIIGIIISTVITFLLTKYYNANSRIFLTNSSVNSQLLESSGRLEAEINLFYEPEFTQNILDKLSEKGFSISRSELSSAKEVRAELGAPAILIKIVSEDPILAAELANTLADEFFSTSILNSKSFLINALKIIADRENLLQEDINRDLSEQQSLLLSSLTMQQENLITQISEFESELEKLELENQIFNFELERITGLIEDRFPAISEELFYINDSLIDSLIETSERLYTVNNLSAIAQKLGGFEIKYLWPDNYSAGELSRISKELSAELENYIDSQYKDDFESEEGLLKNLIKKYYNSLIMVNSIDLSKSTIFNNLTSLESQFNRIPFANIENARDSRLKKFNNSLLLKLKTRQTELLSNQENYLADVDYLNKAEIPDSYFSPNFTFNIFLGGIIGLLVGIMFAVTSNSEKIELIESTVDLNDYGFKVLAKIPNIPAGSPILFDTVKKNNKNDINAQIIESFASIETYLKYGSLDKSFNSVMITSGDSGEGKSIIASNIAIALAKMGNKVLLVDLNLKYPVLYKFFKIKSTPSLAHFLFRKKELDDIIRKTHVENLDLITCIEFPQNPSVIITSERMKNFLDLVKPKYDYIIYDSSSVSVLKETLEIVKFMDEVMVVVRMGKTKLSELFSLQKLLNEKSIFEFDVILNDVNEMNS